MNVTTKTTKTFAVTDLTEQQAQDLMNVACIISDGDRKALALFEGEQETMNNLRQALLQAGVTKQ